jgi:phosphoglycolate phosphatase-like HAD superfamily hydrolase
VYLFIIIYYYLLLFIIIYYYLLLFFIYYYLLLLFIYYYLLLFFFHYYLLLLLKGVEELTRRLHESGMKMAVATSSRSDALPAKRQNHEGLFRRLEFVICGDDPEVRVI